MRKFNKKDGKKTAEFFKALGHPTRLWIVEQLADGKEHCVCEFVTAVGVDFSTVSKHLTVLKTAGVIADDKRGKEVYYRLDCKCIATMLKCVKQRNE